MKRALVAVGAVTLLLLTGCSAPAETPAGGAEPASAATEQTTAPLTASTPEPSSNDEEAAFLEEVRSKLRPDNVIPDATDEQLLAAGRKACAALATRVDGESISVIDGETMDAYGYYRDSVQIVQAAADNIC